MTGLGRSQADNMKDFVNASDKQAYLKGVQSKIDTINQAYDVIIGGRKLTETDIYKSHAPVFKQIYERLISESLLSMATHAISRFMQPSSDLQSNLTSAFNNLLSLASQTTPEEQDKLSAKLFLPNEDIDRILKGIKDYEAESNDTYKNKDPLLKKKRAVELYKDAYEMYLKIIRNIYWRETGADRKLVEEGRRNGDIRSYFSKNYPVLLTSVNNALRKDDTHLNYDERDKYTADEIMTSANEVLTELITAIVVNLQLYKDIFEFAVSSDVGNFLSGNGNNIV